MKKIKFKDKCDICGKYDYCKGVQSLSGQDYVVCKECQKTFDDHILLEKQDEAMQCVFDI